MYRDFRNGTAITLPHLWFIDLKLAETFQKRVFTFCKDFVKKSRSFKFLMSPQTKNSAKRNKNNTLQSNSGQAKSQHTWRHKKSTLQEKYIANAG